MLETLLAQAAAAAATELGKSIANNPVQFFAALDAVIGQCFSAHEHHTGYNAIQDIWDAVAAGHLSHSAALQATAILAGDLERHQQVQSSPLDKIRQYAEHPHTGWRANA